MESRAIVSLVNDDVDYSCACCGPVPFGSYFVRRLITSTTDNFQYQQQVPIYLDQTSISYVSEIDFGFPLDVKVPSGTYYIQCKYQNVLFGCCPVLHTYPI
jgi:hypothetical protein